MFKKKKEDISPLTNNPYDEFYTLYNTYPEQNNFYYNTHSNEHKYTYKKSSAKYTPSPYKVHSYIGYDESNDHSMIDTDMIKEKMMNV